jgi:AraC family transcriptional regulator
MPTDEPAVAGDSDDTLATLLATAKLALDTDSDTARTCIQQAAALLGIDLAHQDAMPMQSAPTKGGLAPWQARRVRVYIDDNLAANINARDLAGIAQLSTSHFFRAFRESFGEAPRSYLMRRRIARAQELMLSSQRSLLDIARECGIGDQPHFTRVFHRLVGINPNAWRRQFFVSSPPEASSSITAERSAALNTRNASCLSK